jgi:hypothetical protein
MQASLDENWRRLILSTLAVILVMTGGSAAHGSAALLVEEPYGFFGGVNPTGHAAIYLNNVCAETPLILRRCQPGETGVVISRYQGIGDHDWIAMPLLPYLYAVENADEVPLHADAATVALLQKKYGEAHLEGLSIKPNGRSSGNGYDQLLGVAYIRKIYAFEFSTEQDQDDRFIEAYNSSPNESHFNLFTKNCADFSKQLINFYYPGAVRRSFTADFAITTPKQIAKSLVHYSHHHERLAFSEFAISQVPGSIPRSHRPRGVLESLVMTKKYAIPIGVFHPYFLVGMAATYLTTGRFNLSAHAPVVAVDDLTATMVTGKVLADDIPKAILPPTETALRVSPGHPALPDGASALGFAGRQGGENRPLSREP